MPRSYHCRILAITAEVLDSDKLNVVSYRLILYGGKLVGATHVIVKVITNNDSLVLLAVGAVTLVRDGQTESS